jgi:ATP-dependent helicase/nuclease subunit A
VSGRPVPPDQPARLVIQESLDRNLLVEAGAGSGKTTALVERMVRLVATGTAHVDEIAAVTFTRKAAGELRQRFQERLERALGEGDRPPVEHRRLHGAVRDVDRAFIGTIHAFCARLLRERPLEARLDPGFRELTAPEEATLARWFWESHLERMAAEGHPALDELDRVAIRPRQLFDLFRSRCEASDVTFPLEHTDPPDPAEVDALRRRFDALLLEARAGIPDPREVDLDAFQKKVKKALFLAGVRGLDDDATLFEAAHIFCTARAQKVTQKTWAAGKAHAVEVRDAFNALFAEPQAGDPLPLGRRLVQEWQAHRYGPVMRFVGEAADAFQRHRRRTGQLTFHDLLVLAVDLLRRAPAARGALGERFRRILVDEFQDTDPLQADLIFLLGSDPANDPPGDPPWTALEPRPGQLFVVGDPKQSIYRFRRADIALYNRVRARFEEFGQVLLLTANFRSVSEVGELVDGVFQGRDAFPPEATEVQAAFAPLATVPPADGRQPPSRGIYWYEVPDSEAGKNATLLDWDAEAVATWIAGRVEAWRAWRASGEGDPPPAGARPPGDFLVLTRKKWGLAEHARALESRNVPVVVSGSGVGVEEELGELRIVLEALCDPDDPVKVVAALEGLFFGLDPEQLVTYHEAGGRFDPRRTTGPAGDAVTDALARLGAWWRLSLEVPSDELVERIVASIGLLPWAAGGELGSIRAGALAFTLDTIRRTALDGHASVQGALDALALVLDQDDSDVEAPLEPGRADAVRVMNLHKVKGLEAPVVVLANPAGSVRFGRSMVVERDTEGRVLGWCAVQEKVGWSRVTLAAPPDWNEREKRERAFEEAEETRLRYVAATRAADELVVGIRGGTSGEKSPWHAFEAWVKGRGERLVIGPEPAPERDGIAQGVPDLETRERTVDQERARRAHPGYGFHTVTGIAKGPGDPAAATREAMDAMDAMDTVGGPEGQAEDVTIRWRLALADSSGPGGLEWGNAVHQVLEAAGRGIAGEALRAAARTALLENDRPVEAGEPTELDTLLDLVGRIREDDLWRQATASARRLIEQPFVVESVADGVTRYLEGVIDLAFLDDDGWTVVDYKTDRDDPGLEARLEQYRRQIRLYGRALERLSGQPVSRRIVWFVRGGRREEVAAE